MFSPTLRGPSHNAKVLGMFSYWVARMCSCLPSYMSSMPCTEVTVRCCFCAACVPLLLGWVSLPWEHYLAYSSIAQRQEGYSEGM